MIGICFRKGMTMKKMFFLTIVGFAINSVAMSYEDKDLKEKKLLEQ